MTISQDVQEPRSQKASTRALKKTSMDSERSRLTECGIWRNRAIRCTLGTVSKLRRDLQTPNLSRTHVVKSSVEAKLGNRQPRVCIFIVVFYLPSDYLFGS